MDILAVLRKEEDRNSPVPRYHKRKTVFVQNIFAYILCYKLMHKQQCKLETCLESSRIQCPKTSGVTLFEEITTFYFSGLCRGVLMAAINKKNAVNENTALKG